LLCGFPLETMIYLCATKTHLKTSREKMGRLTNIFRAQSAYQDCAALQPWLDLHLAALSWCESSQVILDSATFIRS
jgi:hypothetical protein